MNHAQAPELQQKKRCTIYIDGYNWYYAIFKHKPAWKWLNLQSFFEELRIDDDVVSVKLFTALIDPEKDTSEARDRMKRYLKAVSSLSKVKVILGTYQNRTVTCRANCRLQYKVPEEKKSDVNMAVNLLGDAIKSATDRMVIVSGDSDLEPAVAWVRANYPGVKISVYIPSLPDEQVFRRNDYYKTIGVPCSFLPLESTEKHQLPKKLCLPNGGFVERPEVWK